MLKTSLIFSCEHASREIPGAYAAYFQGQEKRLATHQGWDIGAYQTFKQLKKSFNAQAISAKHSRLLIDLNRSLTNPRVFSDISRALPISEKEKIIKTLYIPYRETIKSWIQSQQFVLHIAVHSFTPCLNNQRRHNDIGLLYDPRRPKEALFCKTWQKVLKNLRPTLKVRRNYPYLGVSDGLTKTLRQLKSPETYVGIELEINQMHFFDDGSAKTDMIALIQASLTELLETCRSWNA